MYCVILMTCTFIKAEAICSTPEQALKVKALFDPVLELQDFTVETPEIYIGRIVGNDNVVRLSMYVKDDTLADLYVSKFIEAFENKTDKSDFIGVKIVSNEQCVLDEGMSKTDIVEVVYDWGLTSGL